MIVNADDFGRDSAVNAAVVLAFRQGLISSTTLMANQTGFDEAVELGHEHRLERHIGVHLVLTEGVPLTDGIRRSQRFCDLDGRFRQWRDERRAFRIDDDERVMVVAELAAQVTCAQQAGFPITHVDSHHHVHAEWAIGACVLDVCGQHGIPYVRLARNIGAGIGVGARAYKRLYNRRLARAGRAGTRWFGDVADWQVHATSKGQGAVRDVEVMTHPVLDASGRLVEAGGVDFARHVAPLDRRVAAISYSGARYDA